MTEHPDEILRALADPGRLASTGALRTCHRYHASPRRHLVREGFLDRDHGLCRRSGGRIEA
jgi:hypothetical protein